MKVTQVMKKTAYLITFFTVAPLTLFISVFSLLSLNNSTSPLPKVLGVQTTLIENPHFGVQVYAALPNGQPVISSGAISADARVEIIRQYLARYNSPLEPYADLLVQISDQNGLDFRILTAIAQQESNLCKKSPAGTYNCWGWGIHSQGTLGFTDYPTAIRTVAQGIKEDYLDKGYDTVDKMMAKYTPMSNGSWAFGVTQFIQEME